MTRTTIATTDAASPTSHIDLGGSLTPALLEQAGKPVTVTIPDAARSNVARCHTFALDCIAEGREVYGMVTGYGPMVVYPGNPTHAAQCESAISHLIAGHGDDLAPRVVRAAMLCRLRTLAAGRSGVSVAVLDHLTAALATGIAPAVPRLGSVGASGDLMPLAYVADALRGRGFAYLDGERLAAAQALDRAGLTPLDLDGRDALALVNGTSMTAAAAGLAVASALRSHRVALLLTALLTDVLGADKGFLSESLLAAFGHGNVASAGKLMRAMLDGSHPSNTRPLQEPYSIRCSPQLLGAVGSSVRHAEDVVVADLNGVSDNPLFFADAGTVAHGGNFFGQPLAFAADLLTLAVVQMGNLAERQLDLLIDPGRNGGLPPMLAKEPGRQHALQGVQLAATATVANMRRLATPASIQSLPTNLHNQDIVPLGTQAALNCLDLTYSLRYLHGALGLALRQAVHSGSRGPTAPASIEVMGELVDTIPPIDDDRPLDKEVQHVADILDRTVHI